MLLDEQLDSTVMQIIFNMSRVAAAGVANAKYQKIKTKKNSSSNNNNNSSSSCCDESLLRLVHAVKPF